jgi:hypothetical protein
MSGPHDNGLKVVRRHIDRMVKARTINPHLVGAREILADSLGRSLAARGNGDDEEDEDDDDDDPNGDDNDIPYSLQSSTSVGGEFCFFFNGTSAFYSSLRLHWWFKEIAFSSLVRLREERKL